jgi:uncharacterized phage-associated protein
MRPTIIIDDKTIAAFLYAATRLGKKKSDMHSVFKALYFADRKHLSEFGRMITKDGYHALPDGPVPTLLFDICKESRLYDTPFEDIFKLEGRMHIVPLKEPDLEELSESDIECLNSAIDVVKNMDFSDRRKYSHDSAYEKAWKKKQNSRISVIDIAEAGDAHEEIIQYLNDNIG